MGHVDEVFVVQVFGDAVTGPGTTTHAQGEIKAIVETAAVAKRMRLVHQHANDVQFLGKLLCYLLVAIPALVYVAYLLVRWTLLGLYEGAITARKRCIKCRSRAREHKRARAHGAHSSTHFHCTAQARPLHTLAPAC